MEFALMIQASPLFFGDSLHVWGKWMCGSPMLRWKSQRSTPYIRHLVGQFSSESINVNDAERRGLRGRVL
jgi:hypothetical protein